MPTWQDFATAAPELAEFAFERLNRRPAYLATLQADGAPRVHPISPFVGQGHLFVYMQPTSPKARDLVRDSRYSLHCAVEDHDGGAGELAVSGRARLVPDPDERALVFAAARSLGHSPQERYVVFELEVERVLTTTYAAGKTVRRRWLARQKA
jgi:Pyridoxamine 5'-phosphate oxidase